MVPHKKINIWLSLLTNLYSLKISKTQQISAGATTFNVLKRFSRQQLPINGFKVNESLWEIGVLLTALNKKEYFLICLLL